MQGLRAVTTVLRECAAIYAWEWASIVVGAVRRTGPMKTALLFPGQGSQKVGMGRDLAQKFEVARRTYEEADDVLGFALASCASRAPRTT